jgi:ectoine hydroxylase-related dioxygenase (phytanoyl-CoA dioxygenase family)
MQSASEFTEQSTYRALSQEQIDSFWTYGFLPIGKILNDGEIDLLRREYDGEFERAQAGQSEFRNLSVDEVDDQNGNKQSPQQMLQIMQMGERNIHFHKLLYDDRILDIIEDLIGPNIQLFHDQALHKPAHHGGPVHWHQDNAYWQCSPPNLVSCWLTLDDVDIHNGAMQFLPGTHFQAEAHDRTTATNPLLNMDNNVDSSQAVVANLPAGGIAIHHCQTLHHTAPNSTDRQRRAFAMHFMTPGTRSMQTGEYLAVSFGRPILRARA